MTNRKTHDELIEFLACALHYQETGEPDHVRMTTAEIGSLWSPVPEAIRQRYLNDAKFRMQVQRAANEVIRIFERSSDEPTEKL